MSCLARLIRDRRGNAAVELALAAPFLATMVIGVADISTAYGRKLEIEQASQRAIEKVMQTTGDTTVASAIQKEAVCQVNGTRDDGTCETGRLAEANVSVTYRLECVDTAGVVSSTTTKTVADEFDLLSCTAPLLEARYIEVRVTDTYDPMFPVHFGTGADGDYDLETTAGVRVE